MKYINLLIWIVIPPLFLIDCDGITNPPDDNRIQFNKAQSQVVASGNTFGIDLLKAVSGDIPDENLFISPFSVSMALGMTMNGARGETYDSMRTVLGFGSLSKQEINEAYKYIVTTLTDLDPDVTFEVANAIWIKEGFPVLAPFLKINQDYFDAQAEELNFNDPETVDYINGWVSDKTHNKIPTILDVIPSEVIMYLMNAIYFNGTWTREFNPDKTAKQPFYLQNDNEMTVDMMSLSDTLPYFETESFQAVDIPYGNGHFSMTILLPRDGIDINTLLSEMDYTAWLQWMDSFETQNGLLEIPKFSLTFKMRLNEILKMMGMGIAFNRALADFSGISQEVYDSGERLYISEVLHKTFVRVDEEGTEAAAVTSVSMGATSAPSGFYMIINSPFLCVIRERSSNTILFAGKVMEPEAAGG